MRIDRPTAPDSDGSRARRDPLVAARRLTESGPWRVATGGARRLRDLVMPARCPACGDLGLEPGLCGTCWRTVPWIAPPLCDRLGLPLDFESDAGGVSLAARADPPPYARARAVALHEGPARRIVHALKYQDRQDLAPMMGLWMARAGAQLLAEADVVVPVPLHWLRLVRRGFNQSGVLAEAVGDASGVEVVQALRRLRRTRQQVGLGGRARRRNVEGAFALRDKALPAVAGRRVVLVDDVVTTGATVHACVKALRRAGAAEVDVLAFSRVPVGLEGTEGARSEPFFDA